MHPFLLFLKRQLEYLILNTFLLEILRQCQIICVVILLTQLKVHNRIKGHFIAEQHERLLVIGVLVA